MFTYLYVSECCVLSSGVCAIANDKKPIFWEHRLKVREKWHEVYFCEVYHCDADSDILFTLFIFWFMGGISVLGVGFAVLCIKDSS